MVGSRYEEKWSRTEKGKKFITGAKYITYDLWLIWILNVQELSSTSTNK